MSTTSVTSSFADSFKNIFCFVPRKRAHEVKNEITAITPQSPWYTLPRDLRVLILNLVGEPLRTSLIDRKCREISKGVYSVLLRSYTSFDLPYPESLKKCQEIYTSLLKAAKRAGIKMEEAKKLRQETDPCSSRYLQPVLLAMNTHSFRNFCYRIFPDTPIPMDEIDWTPPDCSHERLDLLDCRMSYLTPKIGLFTRATHLSLGRCGLVELPPELKNLTSLKQLEIFGNSLDVDNVREIFKGLPLLESVWINENDPAMQALLKNEFPHIKITFFISNLINK